MITQSPPQLNAQSLKESIRDLAQLQRTYDPSDEVLWTYFNNRVLLDQPITVDDFVRQAYGQTFPQGQLSAAYVA